MHTSEETQAAFDRNVGAWLAYTASPGGRLRHEVILHNLARHLPRGRCRVLDVGGGTGEMAAALARLGHDVTLLDFSAAYLDAAREQCAGLNVRFVCAEAGQAADLLGADSFDAVLCHSLLEFVADAPALLAQLTRLLCRPGTLSVVTGNRHHWAMREALLRRDLRRARQALSEDMGGMDCFGLPRRTFYPDDVRTMLVACGLSIAAEYGVRLVADLIESPPEAEELLAFELAASALPAYRRIARFIQLIAVKG